MAGRLVSKSGGTNGEAFVFAGDDGDTFDLRLSEYVNFERGIVGHVKVPTGGQLELELCSDSNPGGDLSGDHPDSPFTQDARFYQYAPFETARVKVTGETCSITLVIPPGRGGKVELL